MRPRVLHPAQAMTVPGLWVQLAAKGCSLMGMIHEVRELHGLSLVRGALSLLPSLPQQGYRDRARQKKAFGIGLGRSREWAQILTS